MDEKEYKFKPYLLNFCTVASIFLFQLHFYSALDKDFKSKSTAQEYQVLLFKQTPLKHLIDLLSCQRRKKLKVKPTETVIR